MCACSHVRAAHDCEGDFDGASWAMFYGACEGESEAGEPCDCEHFEEM